MNIDLGVFRAFVMAAERLAEIHALRKAGRISAHENRKRGTEAGRPGDREDCSVFPLLGLLS